MNIEPLRKLYKTFATHPESQWIMQADNAVRLYEYITKNNFKKILALGTGIGLSDAVIALAMLNKGNTDFHIDSIEQFDKCIKLANELIPQEFKNYITIHKSEVKVWSTEKIPYQYFSIFETLPEGNYDLIINDGPGPFEENGNYIELPNGVIHKLVMEDKIKPGTQIIYDGRIQSLKLLERYFSDNFYQVRVPQGRDDFNILERKNTPFVFRDEKFDDMKNTTPYFKEAIQDAISTK